MIKDENYYVVQGWMATQLGLKGTKRDVYAIIYGFTQNNENEFSGSLSYLQEWCNASKVTIIKCLQELVDDGLIIKEEEYKNNVKFCRYKTTLQVVKKLNHPIKENLMGGSKETLPNNIDNINNIKRVVFTPPTYEDVKKYAIEKHCLSLAKPFYDYFTEGNWKDSKGNKVRNWKQKFLTWMAHDTQPREERKSNFSTGRQYTREEMNSNFMSLEEVHEALNPKKPKGSNFSCRRNYTKEEINSVIRTIDEIEI